MRKYISIFSVLVCFLCLTNIVIADTWISYQGPYIYQPTHHIYSNINQPYIISQQPQYLITYQWVPYTTYHYSVTEHRCLFRKEQTIVVQPYTQWLYQPVLINR